MGIQDTVLHDLLLQDLFIFSYFLIFLYLTCLFLNKLLWILGIMVRINRVCVLDSVLLRFLIKWFLDFVVVAVVFVFIVAAFCLITRFTTFANWKESQETTHTHTHIHTLLDLFWVWLHLNLLLPTFSSSWSFYCMIIEVFFLCGLILGFHSRCPFPLPTLLLGNCPRNPSIGVGCRFLLLLIRNYD